MSQRKWSRIVLHRINKDGDFTGGLIQTPGYNPPYGVNFIMHSKTGNVCALNSEVCEKHEIVTVVMRVEDYHKLKKLGGPRPDQIHMALYHYLEIVGGLGWQSNIKSIARMYENVTSYQCTLKKSVCDEIRHLKGRFDDHTIEALRLYLR